MRLRDARPEDLLRCGVVFGQVAEQVTYGIDQARQAASVRWTGRPNQRYQAQLEELCGRMRKVEASHDAACDVLLTYSRALEPARDLALQADLLDAQAEDLSGARVQGPGWSMPAVPEEIELRTRALLLRQEAVTREQTASSRCASQLREFAGDAPRTRGFQVNRFFSDAGTATGQSALGTAMLGRDAFLSVPGIGGAASRDLARHALWEQAQAMAQPWTMIEQDLNELADGRSGLVASQLAGVLILRGARPPGKSVRLFGSHDQMHPAVLQALLLRVAADGKDLTKVNGWVLARAQRKFLQELQRLQRLPAPTVQQLIDGDLNLMQQEALGGHTIYKHVGRDVDFLRKRQLAEARPGCVPNAASSFIDEAEATRLINRAMSDRSNAAELREFAASTRADLRIQAPAVGHGLMVDSAGVSMSPTSIMIEFRRNPDGTVFLNTAFLDHRTFGGVTP